VENVTAGSRGLFRGEDHGALGDVPLVQDGVQDFGRVVTVAQVANLADHEDVDSSIAA